MRRILLVLAAALLGGCAAELYPAEPHYGYYGYYGGPYYYGRSYAGPRVRVYREPPHYRRHM